MKKLYLKLLKVKELLTPTNRSTFFIVVYIVLISFLIGLTVA